MSQSKLEPITQDFIQIFRNIGQVVGIDNLTITITSILFVEPKEISMEDLAKKSGYSLTSISQKIKAFVPFGIIKKRTKPGSRKVYLYMEKDLFETWKNQIVQAMLLEIKVVKENIPGFVKKYKSKVKTKEDKAKLKIIDSYYKQAMEFEKILQKLLIEIEKHQAKLKNNGK